MAKKKKKYRINANYLDNGRVRSVEQCLLQISPYCYLEQCNTVLLPSSHLCTGLLPGGRAWSLALPSEHVSTCRHLPVPETSFLVPVSNDSSSIGDLAAPFPQSGFAAVECKPTSAALHCEKLPNPSPAVAHRVFFLPCSQELLSGAHQSKALDEGDVPRSAQVWLLRAQLQHQQVKGALQPQHRGLSVNSQLWLDFKGLVGGLLQWIRS